MSRTTSSVSCMLSLVSVARSVLLPRVYNATDHLSTLFRINGIKQCHVEFQRQTNEQKFANMSNRGRVCLCSQSFDKFYIIAYCENINGCYCIQTSSYDRFHLSSLEKKVLHFLLSRINKLDSDFFYRQILSLVCLLSSHVTSLSSHRS